MLAQIYIVNEEIWGHLPKDLVDYSARLERQRSLVVDNLVSYADIACLQEADTLKFDQEFGNLIKQQGKSFVQQGTEPRKKKKGKSEPFRISCVTVYDPLIFKLIDQDHRSRCLILALELIETGKIVYVVNVHLEGHPDLEKKRIEQLMSSIKSVNRMHRKLEPNSVDDPAVIIAGDFNSDPHDCIFRMLKNGNLPGNTSRRMIDGSEEIINSEEISIPWKVQCALEEFELVSEENILPSYVVHVAQRVDFIWFSESAFKCAAVLRVIEDEEFPEILQTRLPNFSHPSDHLPIATVLLL
jgi:mRNA deadenylase 3'-5' endonuclease subunit Ccr4